MKRNSTNYWIYLGMMTVFCALIYFALCTGQHIDHPEVSSTVNTEMSSFELFKRIISDNLANSLTILLLQIIVILITVRIFSGSPVLWVKSWPESSWDLRCWDISFRNSLPRYSLPNH